MRFFADLVASDFLLPSFLCGLLAAVACGVLGPLVVTRRIVFLCEGISHAAIFGVGAALAARHFAPGLPAWLGPHAFALTTALLCAVALAWLHEKAPQRMDAMIGGLVAIGLSGGLLLASTVPGRPNLMLFGNLAGAGWPQVWTLLALDAVILGTVLLFHKPFLALCVDEQQLRLQGLRAPFIHGLLLALVAVTVVALMQVVGTLLVVALIALPAATAGLLRHRLAGMMMLAAAICAVETVIPRALVYGSLRIAPEPAIVLAAGLVFLAVLGWKKWAK